MVNVNRDEWETLQNLQAALAAGLDPNFAMSVFSDVTGGAQQRHETRRANVNTQLNGLYDLATQLAQSGATQEAVQGTVLDRGASMLPQSPYAQKRLAGLGNTIMDMDWNNGVSGLVPADARAQLGIQGGTALDPSDVQFISEQVKNLVDSVAVDPQTGEVGSNASVIQARQLIRSMFEASGAPPEQLAMIDQLVTDQWYGFGGPGPGEQGLRAPAGVPASGGNPNVAGNMQPGQVSPFSVASAMPGSDVYSLSDVVSQRNPYTQSWQGDNPSLVDKIIGAPRSFMDDILAWLD